MAHALPILVGLLILAIGVRFLIGAIKLIAIAALVIGSIAMGMVAYRYLTILFRRAILATVALQHEFHVHRVALLIDAAVIAIALGALVVGFMAIRPKSRRALERLTRSARVWSAVRRLRRERMPLTPQAVSEAAHVDRETAIAWLSANAKLSMPSFGTR